MVRRLVLGSGALVQPLVEALDDQPGSVVVGTENDHIASLVQEHGATVERLDPTDESAFRHQFDVDIDVVVVAHDSNSKSVATTRTVRRVFPDAYLLAYAGTDTPDQGASLETLADDVLVPGQAVAGHILERVGEPGHQLRQLWQVLRSIDRLAVVAHDNPDPDAIASGVALAKLAGAAGCEADVCYYGSISHQENRAFVNVLDLSLRELDPEEGIDEYDGIALVDHSRPGVNDQLPEDTPVDIVIDHHPPRAPVDARFVDLRSGVGSTSTLLVDYLDRFGLGFDTDIATALLFGIHVDTDSFTRGVAPDDFEAAARLVPAADLGTLERIESPSMTAQTLETLARGIQNRQVEGEILHSFVGHLGERDALSQAADLLLSLDGVTATMVYGVREGTIHVSARARGSDLDIGETLRDAFDQIGSAGGHTDMAGAQLTLGLLDAVDQEDESLQGVIEDVVANRFMEALTQRTDSDVTGVYGPVLDPDDEYLTTPPDAVTTDDGVLTHELDEEQKSSDADDEEKPSDVASKAQEANDEGDTDRT